MYGSGEEYFHPAKKLSKARRTQIEGQIRRPFDGVFCFWRHVFLMKPNGVALHH